MARAPAPPVRQVDYTQDLLRQVHAALEREPRINLHRYPLGFEVNIDGTLVLEGEAENIAAKKIALRLAASVEGITGIIDRLRVARARTMGDGLIRDHIRDALLQEPAFENCSISLLEDEESQSPQARPTQGQARIEVSVKDGVVTLNGEVGSPAHKSLAGVLAWWVPGTRDVINGLEVVPEQEQTDEDIADAVRLVLEKDPLVNASAIRVRTRNALVTLEGLAASEEQRHLAEMDAWYVFGVDQVVNRLENP